ncbi:MAG: hypothetical protein ACLFVW_08160 [Phycisphaerae bacterium]
MLLGMVLIAAGALSMAGGVLLLLGWVSGKSTWFDSAVFDRPGASKNDRQYLDLYFSALVLAPLLGGGLMIAFGLVLMR